MTLTIDRPLPISFADIEAAAGRLRGKAVRTPLIASPVLDEITGGRVLVKPEVLQRTGSFKFRGAYNRVAMIPEADRARGVVACSSGNHAQGVAEAAGLFGIPATIVMPSDAPAIKRMRTERAGATVVLYERATEDRNAIAAEISARTGATFVHPYDDPGVMAGQGTTGLEIGEDLAALGIEADEVLVPVSGGGLLAGVALGLARLHPSAVCKPVEPVGFDDLTRSLVAGHHVANAVKSGSLADALMAQQPGVHTFEVHKMHVAPGYTVPEAALWGAMAFAANELKLVTEPGGAIALAAVLDGIVPVRGRTIVIVLSGANVDPAMLARALMG